MKCTRCKTEERHGQLAYCLPCNAAYLKEYREKKKAKMDEPVNGLRQNFLKVKSPWADVEVVKAMDDKVMMVANEQMNKTIRELKDRQSGVDRPYIHTGPNPKIKRCQAGYNGSACPNEGMPATIGEYKAWLCFAHSSMGKFVVA